MIRVIIVEDSPEFVDILKSMFENDGGIEVVAEAKTKEDAYQVCINNDADIVLVDLNLGGHNKDGFDVINEVKRYTNKHNFIVLTGVIDAKIIAITHLVGAMRYVAKGNLDFIIPVLKDAYRLLPHLREAALYEAKMAERILLSDLTDACKEIYHYWIKGYSVQEISHELSITEEAARKRVARLKDRLNK